MSGQWMDALQTAAYICICLGALLLGISALSNTLTVLRCGRRYHATLDRLDREMGKPAP